MYSLFALAGLGLLGIGALHFHRRRSRVLRELSGVRATSISRVACGAKAKVVGTLEYVGEPLVSPLTGRRCAFYHIVVEEQKRDMRWYEVIREEKRINFQVSDGDGAVAMIVCCGAKIVADICADSRSGPLNAPSPAEVTYLATHGKRDRDWFRERTLRFREGILEAGEVVSVYGRGVREPDPELAHEAPVGALATPLRLRGSDEEPLLISDNAGSLG